MPVGAPTPRGPLYHSPGRASPQRELSQSENDADGTNSRLFHQTPARSAAAARSRSSIISSSSAEQRNRSCNYCCSSFFSLKTLSLLICIIAIFVGIGIFLDQPKHWVFDPKVLQEVAQTGILLAEKKAADAGRKNATATEVINQVIAGVKRRYPEYITVENRDWMFNNAGGAMGQMIVLHASLTEYIIIFGTPLGTEGHTGRFPLTDDYFTIIYGEQWASLASSPEKEIYRPGSQHFLPRGSAKQYKCPDSGCFALEYARGNIPSMMPFGLFDTFFSTLDFWTFWQTVEVSAVDMIGYALKGKF